MIRLSAILLAGALLAGCTKEGAPPAFPDLAGLEEEGRKVSDGLAIAISAASAYHDEAVVQAAVAGMAKCPKDDATCKHDAGLKAKADAKPRGDALKTAAVAQNELVNALTVRASCRAKGDLACVADLTGKVAKLLPDVLAKVEAAKGMVSK